MTGAYTGIAARLGFCQKPKNLLVEEVIESANIDYKRHAQQI